MSPSGFKTYPLWYAHVAREAKKEIVVYVPNFYRGIEAVARFFELV